MKWENDAVRTPLIILICQQVLAVAPPGADAKGGTKLYTKLLFGSLVGQ